MAGRRAAGAEALNPAAVDWQPALAVLVVGLVAGGLLLWRMRRSPAPPLPAAGPALDRRDLEARRDVLLRQLRELDDTAAKRSPDQLARERADLELQAAVALRALDRLEARSPAPGNGPAGAPAAAAAAAPPHGAARGFFWGVATATAMAALVFFANRAASPREEGGSLTGAAGPMAAPGGADDDARIDRAREALGRQDMMAVWTETQAVLERTPGHPRALAYQALVRLAMGQGDVAESMLKQALAESPDLLEGYLHLGVVYARTGRMPEAERTVRTAMSRFPDEQPGLARLLEELRQIGPDEQIATGAGDAHAGVAPPDDVHAGAEEPREVGRPAAAPDMGAAADAVGGTPARLSGVVELDPSARGRAGSRGIVFVTVRAAGVTSGPPVAVKRFPAASLPGAFAIGAADSMMGQELPESVFLEARLDPDGDPMSRAATDPAARIDNVKLGTSGLRLVLK
jgi:tetratricopeptide (TPR) repeat protein